MDKEKIIKNLQQAKNLIDDSLHGLLETRSTLEASKHKNSITQKQTKQTNNASIIIDIVKKTKGCDEYEAIEKNILDQSSQDKRILLCYYISSKYFNNTPLTTTDVEKITRELEVTVKQPNVAKKIKNSLYKYLDSETPRKSGKPTLYRMKRSGIMYLEEILYGKK